MMIETSLSHCDCCGLPISGEIGDDCPRCGYPINVAKEEQFLESSLLTLRRVAAYGGASITVSQLINRYRDRLNHLNQSKLTPVGQAIQNIPPVEASINAISAKTNENAGSQAPFPQPSEAMPAQLEPVALRQQVAPVSAPVSQAAPARSFSLGSFLEEQTINIVASLGAFLILVGALSFVATTANLLFSFLVVFIVHAIFGSIGIVSYRFRSFRTVAAIYTAIFALLVPLVGFSAYRLVSGNLVQFSTPALVAIAATYAALVYGALAVYQKFSPFGYLAVVAMTVAMLATASACNLGYWWWPSAVMLLALPSLLSVPRRSGNVRPFVDPWTILREPILVFMGTYVAACAVSIPIVFAYSVSQGVANQTPSEIRFSLVCMALLLLCWNALFTWRTKRTVWALALPYLFLLSALTFAYALSFSQVGYVLVLTAVALLYHGLTRFAPRLVQYFKETVPHLEGLALLLVALVPLIAVPFLPLYLVSAVYAHESPALPFSWDLVVDLVAIVAGCTLTISIVLNHTGLRKIPVAPATRWRWLLLFSAFLLNAAYGLFILLIRAEPVWWLLGLSLVLVVVAVIIRRFVSAAWANPLDVLALIEIVWTLLFSFNLGADGILGLWLFVAALLYAVVLYQRRPFALFLPVFFAVLILPVLFARPRVLLIASIILPLASAGIHRFLTERWNASSANFPVRAHKNTVWEWPLLAIGVFYGIAFGLYDTSFANTYASALPASTVESWLHVHFPVSLELATIALFWYASAALARVKWWSLAVVGFAVAALLVPGNSFWVLAWLAPVLALLGLGVGRLAGKDWALPLYSTSVFAAVIMGVTGYTQGQMPAATLVLLLFSVLVYLISVIEQSVVGVWIAPIFATWSVFYSGQLGDLYRPPVVALVCAALGVALGCLRFLRPVLSSAMGKKRLLDYALPLYATACAAAVLTGVYGMLASVNYPFFAAIPTALLVYALAAYGVVLFERSARWQWLVFAFATWGILFLPQAASCSGTVSSGQAFACNTQQVLYYLAGIVLLAGIAGFLAGLISRRVISTGTGTVSTTLQARLGWSWSWYSMMLVALVTTVGWSRFVSILLPTNLVLSVLCLLIGFTLLLTLLERAPEMLLVPIALAVWTLAQVQWPLWQQMIAYSLLCALIFATQFIWRVLTPRLRIISPTRLYQGLSIGGQVLVILAIIVQGGLFASAGLLAHVGAGALFMLALLIFCYGLLDFDKTVRRVCNYSVGMLCSLVFSWELSAFGLNHLDWLTLAPAVYLIVVAPFLSRDPILPRHHLWGQVCSIIGASLLLLPMLWISFSEGNLTPTLILAGEALGLLLLGTITRIRFFVLSGAALTVIATMHALFLPSLGIPTSLALAILGLTLLAIATGLSLTRRRLQSVWTEWE